MKKFELRKNRKRLSKHILIAFLLTCFFTIQETYAGSKEAQESTQENSRVRGIVSDDKGEPLIGVSISVKDNPSIGTSTDVDGQYVLDLPSKSVWLVFSYIGHITIEEAVAGRSIVNVTMKEELTELEEVTIVGYGTQKKVSISGSISSLPPKELQKISTMSLPNAISGKLPGVFTRQVSGEPGFDAAVVYIRGMATFNNNAPLVLVDGIERDMSNLSMEEIESFSVLKDASATAVYGVRGANGVIIITTKKGKLGKPQISLRMEGAMLNNLSTRNYIDGYQYASLMNEAFRHVGKTEPWTAEQLEKFRTGSDPYLYPNVDWISETLKERSFQSINNLSISGGNDLIRYYTNLGYSIQDGIFVEDPNLNYSTNANMQRINYRSNVDISLSKSFSLELGIGGIIDDRRYPGGGSSAIFQGLRDTSPIIFPVKNPDGSPGGSPVYVGSNPWANATQSGYSDDRISTIQSTFGAKWDLSSIITPGLSVSGRYSYDFYTYDKVLRYKQFAVKQYLGKDPDTGEDMYNEVRPELPLGAPDTQQTKSNRAAYLEGMINYERTFGLHGITAMLLYNQRNYVNLKPTDEISSLPQRNQGLAGRVTYNYNNTYFAEFNAGYNGSENFPKGNRMGFFPSFSVGYLISNEEFWKIHFIDNLKLRGSYGQAGNDNVNGQRFLYLTTVNTAGAGQDYYWDGSWYRGYVENKIGNPNITWEVSTKLNVGIDLGFLHKLSLQVDYFHEDRNNILLSRENSLPWFAGFQPSSIPYGNLGKIKNQGFDGVLEFKDQIKSGFSYSFRTNVSFAHNEVIENDEPVPLYAYESRKGHRLGQPWGFIAEGFFTSEEDIDNWYDQTSLGGRPRVGDIKYQDLNEDDKIDSHDQKAIGYARNPELMFGFGGTAAYKGFDFSIYFTGATRTSTFFEGRSFYPFEMGAGSFSIFQEYYDKRWIPDETQEYNLAHAKYPAATDGANANNFRRSTIWIKDASYIRLKNMEVGYTFPAKLINQVGLSNARLFVNGTNIYTWDKINNVIDAESDNWYPIQMALNFGLQVNF